MNRHKTVAAIASIILTLCLALMGCGGSSSNGGGNGGGGGLKFTWTTLDDPDATSNTYVNGISGSLIVGYFYDNVTYHGFIFNTGDSSWTTLDNPASPDGTWFNAVDGGLIVGGYYDGSDNGRGFIYNTGDG